MSVTTNVLIHQPIEDAMGLFNAVRRILGQDVDNDFRYESSTKNNVLTIAANPGLGLKAWMYVNVATSGTFRLDEYRYPVDECHALISLDSGMNAPGGAKAYHDHLIKRLKPWFEEQGITQWQVVYNL